MNSKIMLGVPCFAEPPDLILRTLRSFLEPDVCVVAVDNGATSDVKTALNQMSSTITILRNPTNIYVNPAWNQIAERFLELGSEILVVSNADLVAAHGWSESLLMRRALGGREFWVATVLETEKEVLRARTPTADAVQTNAVHGAFFAMSREAVKAAFPIPSELRLHCGDDWIHWLLTEAGFSQQTLAGMCVWHKGFVSGAQLAEFHSITEKDRAAWDERLGDVSRGLGRIEKKYAQARDEPSDICEHIPILSDYAQHSRHVTEMGAGRSTWGLLHGRPQVVRSYDVRTLDVRQEQEAAAQAGIDFQFQTGNSMEVVIEETDLLFIDTIHRYAQLRLELAMHASNVRKCILLHDTEVYGSRDEAADGPGLWPAVEEFLADHHDWAIEKRLHNNNGLTILKRMPVIRPLPIDSRNAEAVGYVSTTPEEGLAQLEILKALGCRPEHPVLEIGCGALVAGYPVMQYLNEKRYAGIDPNTWLRRASISNPEVAGAISTKRPAFSSRPDFTAFFESWGNEQQFDFIFSHSILSHASNAQLDEFLGAVKRQLADGGVAAVSIRLAEGNDVGSPGSAIHGEAFKAWQYPGVSWFCQDDVIERARAVGLSARVAPELQAILMRGNPKAVHDWMVFRHTEEAQEAVPEPENKVRLVTAFFRLRDRKVNEDEAFKHFLVLAECGLPILLFIDREMKMGVVELPANVHVVMKDLTGLWSFREDAKKPKPLPSERTEDKDTRDFLLLQNAKLDLLSEATWLDETSTHFAWIDFSIMKIVKDKERFRQRLRELRPPETGVLTPGCWAPQLAEFVVDLEEVCWRFCGGFLCVDRESVTDLVEDYHRVFRSLPKLTWEVNVWAEMERQGTKFDWYKADHDDSILPPSEQAEPPVRPIINEPVFLGVPVFREDSYLLRKSIRSFLEPLVRVVVVDNGTGQELAGQIIRNETNVYVNPAWNQLAQKFLESDAEVFVLANADVVLSRGWSERIWEAAKNPGVFWRGRGVKSLDDLEAPNPEMSAHTSGAFFAIAREDVAKIFPIPEQLKIWYGDNWIWETLDRLGRKAVALDAVRVWHAESVSSRALPEFYEIVRADKLAWESGIAELCRTRPLGDVAEAAPAASTVPRVCLVMIVKNESRIIERCLTHALPFIDCWSITDTGSTDGTQELIKKFFTETHPLPGQLAMAPFHDFAQARNASLAAARTRTDWEYALLIDADMVMRGELDRSSLKEPCYGLVQRSGTIDYWNPRLLRRDTKAEYVGVTHEFLSIDGVPSVPALFSLRVLDVEDGGSKGDKLERDVRLLTEGLAKDPKNGRYLFYLANTLRHMGRNDEAIKRYEERIALGGWDEETWYSIYSIAICHQVRGDEANFVRSCLDAYQFRPCRGESLKILAKYWRERSKNELASMVAEELARIPVSHQTLFYEREVYDLGADEELSIAGFYSQYQSRKDLARKACARLTVHRTDHVREQARRNFIAYVKSASEEYGARIEEIDWKPADGWAPMNPSIAIGPNGQRVVLVRTVNYTVTEQGEYPTKDNSGIIKTHNYLLEFADNTWRNRYSAHYIEDETEQARTKFPVEGFEDCRLYWSDNWKASCTVRDRGDGRCEMATVKLAFSNQGMFAYGMDILQDYEWDKAQKNWMPIIGRPDWFLYLCDPTISVERVSGKTVERTRHDCPVCLNEARGGSQLVPWKPGLFIALVHEVAWNPHRVYLHRFIEFDSNLKIVRFSDLFYFSKVGIEFCAGLALDGDTLVASFGVNDASAHLAFFELSAVDRALRTP